MLSTSVSPYTRKGLEYSWNHEEYLKHLLSEIQKHMDDTNLDFLDNLLP